MANANTFTRFDSSIPQSYMVTLDEAKHYLRIDHNLDDDLINMLITGSLNAAEDYLGYPITSRSLAGQYWIGSDPRINWIGQYKVNWSVDIAPFYVKSVQAVVTQSVNMDASGSIVPSGSTPFTDWVLSHRNNHSQLDFTVFPSGSNTITVQFQTAELSIPASVKVAMLKWIVDNYEQRTSDSFGVSVAKPTHTFENLLHANKTYSI